jgi:hypothetical protein
MPGRLSIWTRMVRLYDALGRTAINLRPCGDPAETRAA